MKQTRNNRPDSKPVKTYSNPHNIMSKRKCINRGKNACQALTHKQTHNSDGTSGLKDSIAAFSKLLFYAVEIIYIMFNIF